MTNDSHTIAEAALNHYANVLPARGKPTCSVDRKEWTVYAAIVATTSTSSRDPWVVSAATGTKCTAVGCSESSILHDCHAEVLARRGLVRVLWKEIAFHQQSKKDDDDDDKGKKSNHMLLSKHKTIPLAFQLRDDIRLHIYISDSPCGDASIYEIEECKATDADANDKEDAVHQFTGAKVLTTNGADVNLQACNGEAIDQSHVAREKGAQLLGKLRTKSGRSNLLAERRSTSMSCSDKLVRWNIIGLQGASLSKMIPEPIRLASCVVSADPRNSTTTRQLEALDRAFLQRTVQARESLKCCEEEELTEFANRIPAPLVLIVPKQFESGKSNMEKARATEQPTDDASRKRKRGQKAPKFSPTGFSINWTQWDDSIELVVGARGIRQGKKPKCDADWKSLESRLCRNRLREAAASGLKGGAPCLYSEWKSRNAAPICLTVRDKLFEKGPLAGWLVGGQREPGTTSSAS